MRLIYFIGLVDILTYYGVKKKTASAAKAVKYGLDADNISTVKPDQVVNFTVLWIIEYLLRFGLFKRAVSFLKTEINNLFIIFL